MTERREGQKTTPPRARATRSARPKPHEPRSFDPKASDDIPHSVAEGRLGPGGDPAEGKP